MTPYCNSRYSCKRRTSKEVFIGEVGIGGQQPIRVQSMTTTNTQDIQGTVAQSRALIEAGCEIVRITAPNVKAAQALKDIRKQLNEDGFASTPLVADIHFLPNAAMEAVEHVEKVRVNPGNYADKKKFAVRDYSDKDYDEELERLHQAFSPLVIRSKQLGRCLRIGTNHGSLSDRIMNRFGDTPLGMAESALEFIRIAEYHHFHDIVLSMKSSNPKVMIQAYRLVVAKMNAEGMHYPLHLGVTEAGDGEDGRIKGAVGIGSLLFDGLGDTLRVSLTEDPVYEVPVAQALADKAHKLWEQATPDIQNDSDGLDPYNFQRRQSHTIEIASRTAGNPEPPQVWINSSKWNQSPEALLKDLTTPTWKEEDNPLEGVILNAQTLAQLKRWASHAEALAKQARVITLLLGAETSAPSEFPQELLNLGPSLNLVLPFAGDDTALIDTWTKLVKSNHCFLSLDIAPDALFKGSSFFSSNKDAPWIFTTSPGKQDSCHGIGAYRKLANALEKLSLSQPIWIRNRPDSYTDIQASFLDELLNASILSGSLLCDGIGDIVSHESSVAPEKSISLTYNVLQGAGARISKTEYVACPSCGRTLFDLQSTTQKIREKTGHLKGVKIAVMGCIVNGPGEMADADFGYVGGAPRKVNLYIGKTCVKYHIPSEEAVDKLIELIKENGKWTDPVN